MPMQRIGVLGGTFDPPRIDHLILAGKALAQLNFSTLRNVHFKMSHSNAASQNKPITPIEHHLAMLNLIMKKDKDIERTCSGMLRWSTKTTPRFLRFGISRSHLENCKSTG
jgi:nicotinic acid mononucleotide adenylyltransferase